VIALWLGCSSAPDADSDEALDVVGFLTRRGPHPVAFHVDEATWVPDESGAVRALRLAWWAPAASTGGPPARYFYGAIEDDDAQADVAVADGAFPWVVFSHGHQGYAEASSFLMEHLASHGFVVAAPDHTGNTALDGSDRETPIYWQRPGDLSAVLDHAAALPAAHPLAGHLGDLAGAIGHSFGGYTVFAWGGAAFDPSLLDACLAGTEDRPVCATYGPDDDARFRAGLGDARVPAVAALAPGDFDLLGSGLQSIGGPVLLGTGGLDSVDGAAFWQELSRDGDAWLDIPRGGHHVFDDFAVALDPPEPPPIPAEEGWSIVSGHVLAWALLRTGDDRGAGVLDGTVLLAGDDAVVTIP
jgi:predicted dienelactone hydrolase